MSINIWQEVTRKLRAGVQIPNWTYAGRGRKETMTIVAVKDNSIEVSSPNAQVNQNVPRKEFEAVWEVWHGYKAGKHKRDILAPITRFSKYIISIFKWMEG